VTGNLKKFANFVGTKQGKCGGSDPLVFSKIIIIIIIIIIAAYY
jgi:hypothetical protein